MRVILAVVIVYAGSQISCYVVLAFSDVILNDPLQKTTKILRTNGKTKLEPYSANIQTISA
jgi:hypothetical protein